MLVPKLRVHCLAKGSRGSNQSTLNTGLATATLWLVTSPYRLLSQVKQLGSLLTDIFTHVSLLDLRWKGEFNIRLFEEAVHHPKTTKAFLESLVYWALRDVNLIWVVCWSRLTLACYAQVQPVGRQDHSDQRPHRRHQPPCGEGGHHHLRVDGQYIFIHIIDTVVSDRSLLLLKLSKIIQWKQLFILNIILIHIIGWGCDSVNARLHLFSLKMLLCDCH